MCVVISPKVRIGCDRVRHKFVSRISYVVYREKRDKEKRTWDLKPSRAHPVDEKRG